MLSKFFMTAVVGPIAAKPVAVAGSCVDCVAASAPGNAQPCAGFGPGCLASPAAGKMTGVNRRESGSPLD